MTGTKSLNAEESWRAGLRVALALFLISPFLIWLLQISDWTWPALSEWAPAVRLAAMQSLLSSVGALLLGFVLFRAAQGWSLGFWQRFVELSLLLPNLVPPLFTVMGILTLGSLASQFPYGLGAVIFVHILLNAGLVAVSFGRLAQTKIAGLAEASFVMGATPHRFWWSVAWPALRGDIACIFLFVFSLCFTSFSIPLLLSGDRAVSLEVSILDFIRLEGRWDKAVILALLQSSALLLLALLLPRPFWPPRPHRARLQLLALPFGRSLVFLPAGLIMLGWYLGFTQSLNVSLDENIKAVLIEACLTTAAIGAAVGLAHLMLFLIVAFVFPHPGLSRFLNGYLAPSPVITGFALILIPIEGDVVALTKLIAALTLISFPLLYRWMVHSSLLGLEKQVEVARSLGASWSAVLFEVVWPQAGAQILRACGLAGVWAVGDFALSGMLLSDGETLPMLIDGLLGSYRIEAAYTLLPPLMILGIMVYGLFVGASRYVHR